MRSRSCARWWAILALGSVGVALALAHAASVVAASAPAVLRVAELGFLQTPGSAISVAAAGDRLYVGEARWYDGATYVGANGLRVLDASDPIHPTARGFVATRGEPTGLAADGTLVYVADLNGLLIVDAADPNRPTVLGALDRAGGGRAVALGGGHAYLVQGNRGVRVVDVSDPAHPAEVAFFALPASQYNGVTASADPWHAAVAGDRLYVTDSPYGDAVPGWLRIYDVADPRAPRLIGSFASPARPYDVSVAGGHAYVAEAAICNDCASAIQGGLRVLDVSDPTRPVEVGSFRLPKAPDGGPGDAAGVALNGSLSYLSGGTPNLHALDVSDPGRPRELAALQTPDVPTPTERGTGTVVVSRGLAYVPTRASGVRVAALLQSRALLPLGPRGAGP